MQYHYIHRPSHTDAIIHQDMAEGSRNLDLLLAKYPSEIVKP